MTVQQVGGSKLYAPIVSINVVFLWAATSPLIFMFWNKTIETYWNKTTRNSSGFPLW